MVWKHTLLLLTCPQKVRISLTLGHDACATRLTSTHHIGSGPPHVSTRTGSPDTRYFGRESGREHIRITSTERIVRTVLLYHRLLSTSHCAAYTSPTLSCVCTGQDAEHIGFGAICALRLPLGGRRPCSPLGRGATFPLPPKASHPPALCPCRLIVLTFRFHIIGAMPYIFFFFLVLIDYFSDPSLLLY